MPAITATMAGILTTDHRALDVCVRQAECMPSPINRTSGSIGMAKAISNHGGPIETLPIPITSDTSGYKVPIRIRVVAMTSSTLFSRRNVSRDSG